MRFHRTTTVYIINDKKQTLMLYHKKAKAWLPPGGHVEENELMHHGAVREVKEETGLYIDFIYDSNILLQNNYESNCLDERAQLLPQPIIVELENVGPHYHEDFIYLARAQDSKITNNEGHEIGWFEFDEAIKLDTYDHVKKHLDFIREKLGY